MRSADYAIRTGDAWFPLIVQHVWSSTVFLLIMLTVAYLMRRRLTASARFTLALLGIAKFAIPSALLSAILKRAATGFEVSGYVGQLAAQMELADAILAPTAPLSGSAIWPLVAMSVWILVAAVLILRHAMIRHRLVSLAGRTAIAPLEREVGALKQAKARLGIGRTVDIARSPIAEAPAVVRTFRPLILLPVSASEDLSDEELEALLCHECAHVARYDNLISQVESVICALFWFHPLIWIAQRMTLIERERACDEIAAELDQGGSTYLDALRKFCHTAIAPRLPGVSCMATAHLKERIEHIMNYSDLKSHAPSPKRVFALAATALALFVFMSGIAGVERLFADADELAKPYSIRIKATKIDLDSTIVSVTVRDNETHRVVAAPSLTVEPGQPATATTTNLGVRTVVNAEPEADDLLSVNVRVERDHTVVYETPSPLRVRPEPLVASTANYTGDPIDLVLEDADLRDVIGLFGQVTGLEMRIDDGIEGKVSVDWHAVPWDQAFAELLEENGLIYRIEGSSVFISKK